MGCNQVQKRGLCVGGLTESVVRLIEGLNDVEVILGTRRGCRGEQKVKIPQRWNTKRRFPIVVCDGMNGENILWVNATKAAAIARILRKKLLENGITVCEK